MTNTICLSGLKVMRLNSHAKLPTKSFESAGYDLYTPNDVFVPHTRQFVVPLGIVIEIPHGYFGKIMDRSGTAARSGVTSLAGVMDNDYVGEWKLILHSVGEKGVQFYRGDRIAQVVFLPYGTFDVVEVNSVGNTERGAKGFGSSGR